MQDSYCELLEGISRIQRQVQGNSIENSKSVGTVVLDDRMLMAHDLGLREVRYCTIDSSLPYALNSTLMLSGDCTLIIQEQSKAFFHT